VLRLVSKTEDEGVPCRKLESRSTERLFARSRSSWYSSCERSSGSDIHWKMKGPRRAVMALGGVVTATVNLINVTPF
jgi:hypothetical protein